MEEISKSKQDGNSWEPTGNPKVLWTALIAFTYGFSVWAINSSLAPYLKDWYGYSASEVLIVAAMSPLFAAVTSLALGIASDLWGGRIIFTLLLLFLPFPMIGYMFADSYVTFLCVGIFMGLGGASFIIGNTHVAVWYPKERQGAALGLYAFGNVGVALGMILVPFLLNNVFGGAPGSDLPPKFSLGPFEGWRLIFPIYATLSLILAFVYWTMTSEPPSRDKRFTFVSIVSVYKSSILPWILAYLSGATFGALMFNAAFLPTYLVDQYDIEKQKAIMLFVPVFVLLVSGARPISGWLGDRYNPRKLLCYCLGVEMVLAAALCAQLPFLWQLSLLYAIAILYGTGASLVVKLIPLYFKEVGAVTGLAKTAGASTGAVMTIVMSTVKGATGEYTYGWFIWTAAIALALVLALMPQPYRMRRS
ncbi:MAG: MFS transporter [Pseudomonadales bacterium]|nr:MFS transporter [Pseudomonadales bacterium]